MPTLICHNPDCHQEYLEDRKHQNKKYCSWSCYQAYERLPVGNLVICRNPECSKEFYVSPARFKQSQHFHCSRTCQSRAAVLIPLAPHWCVCQNSGCQKVFRGNLSRITKGQALYCSRACRFPPLIITCENVSCGKAFRIKPADIKNGRKYCSNACRKAGMVSVICKNPDCEKVFDIPTRLIKNNRGKYCSRRCRKDHDRTKALARLQGDVLVCTECLKPKPLEAFYTEVNRIIGKQTKCKTCIIVQHTLYQKNNRQKINKYQSVWRTKNQEKRRTIERNYRRNHPEQIDKFRRTRYARKKNAPIVEAVKLQTVYARDQGICSLCHTTVTRKDASVDHIIPLSKGGEHSYKNVALAHRRCNSKKHNNIAIQQMRLF